MAIACGGEYVPSIVFFLEFLGVFVLWITFDILELMSINSFILIDQYENWQNYYCLVYDVEFFIFTCSNELSPFLLNFGRRNGYYHHEERNVHYDPKKSIFYLII